MKLALIIRQTSFISFGGRSAVHLMRLWRFLDNFYKSLFKIQCDKKYLLLIARIDKLNHINPTDVIDSNMHMKECYCTNGLGLAYMYLLRYCLLYSADMGCPHK